MSDAAAYVTDAHKRQFQEEGYFVLERVIPQRYLDNLRSECQRFIDAKNEEMDRADVEVLGLNHRDRRYFISTFGRSQKLREFLFSDVMAAVCRATLGGTAYLFNEQYVVKAAEKGMKFDWHQDSGFIDHPHPPYLTCWCTLDDVGEANGTVYLLPYSRAGTREVVPHVLDEETNDRIGYFGDDPGIPVIIPAGSIACFSSTVFHRSGPNTTEQVRRIYLAQYSAEPVMSEDGSEVWELAEPFLDNGRRVEAIA